MCKVSTHSIDLKEDFESSLEAAGYKSVDEFFEFLLSDIKIDYLQDAYIKEKWSELLTEYAPKKAKIMCFNSSETVTMDQAYENATKALAEVQKGGSFATVAAKYGSDSSLANEKMYTSKDTNLDANVAQFISAQTAPTLSDVIKNANDSSYYIVQVTATNEEQIRDDFVTSLKAITDFGDTVSKFYFEKYHFTIYDIDIYNAIKTNYPSYLIQD